MHLYTQGAEIRLGNNTDFNKNPKWKDIGKVEETSEEIIKICKGNGEAGQYLTITNNFDQLVIGEIYIHAP